MKKETQKALQPYSPQKQSFWDKHKGKFAFGGAVVPLSMANTAHAALDVAPLTTEISGNGTSLQTVMLAILALAALFVGFRYIRRAMS